GALEARVIRADGSPAPDGTEVVLGAVHYVTRLDGPQGLGSRCAPARAHTTGGHVRFDGVGLGLEVTLSVNGGGACNGQTFRGPDRAGERVTRTLILPSEPVELHLRAVDERGAPIAGALDVARTVATSGFHNSSSSKVDADSDGRFRVPIERGLL